MFRRKVKAKELTVKKQQVAKIEVRDLKEYLVKDFETIKSNELEINRLKNRIEELEAIEIKYKATLITLEEYDVRIEREKENSRKLENKLSEKQEKIKELNERINDCIIREKKAQYAIENAKETITSEFKENLINVINKQKGHLSKVKVMKLVEET